MKRFHHVSHLVGHFLLGNVHLVLVEHRALDDESVDVGCIGFQHCEEVAAESVVAEIAGMPDALAVCLYQKHGCVEDGVVAIEWSY